jgi:hypothetical protein
MISLELKFIVLRRNNLFLFLSSCDSIFFSLFDFVFSHVNSQWDYLRPIIFGTITEFYSSGEPVLLNQEEIAPSDTEILDTDSQVPILL